MSQSGTTSESLLSSFRAQFISNPAQARLGKIYKVVTVCKMIHAHSIHGSRYRAIRVSGAKVVVVSSFHKVRPRQARCPLSGPLARMS